MTNRHRLKRRLLVEALEPRRLLTSLPFDGHELTAAATFGEDASAVEYTQVWGNNGDLWNPADETLLDFSYAGYHQGENDFPAWEVGANVRDFGAVGDGVTDDTQAFLDAIEACPDNRVVYIPNGTYKLMDWLGVDEMIGTWVKPNPKSRFAFRGEDRDQTVILLGVGLQDIHPWTRPDGTPQWSWHGGFLWFQDSEEVGVENLTIKGSGTQYEGHWSERGYNGVFFKNVEDAWVREVTFINVDSGIIANNSRYITVEDVLFESTPEWPSTSPVGGNFGMSGHHAILFGTGSSWSLADKVVFTNRFHHELTLSSGAHHNVFSDVAGPNLHFDFHTPEDNLYNNLFTEIDAGEGSLIWRNNFYGATTGSVLWNIKGENLSLPVGNSWTEHPVLVEDLETLLVGWPIDLPDLQVVGRPWFEDIAPEAIDPQNIYRAQRNLRLGQPPTVSDVVVDDGGSQRSMVRSLTVTFDQAVVLDTGTIALIDESAAQVEIAVANPSADQTTYEVTFTDPSLVGDSLIDGHYRMTIAADKVHSLGGLTLFEDHVTDFHRLFGDVDGDRDVDRSDYIQIRSTYGRSEGQTGFRSEFDYDGNGTVDALDAAQARSRLNSWLDEPQFPGSQQSALASNTAQPQIEPVVVNDGSVQRSMVTSLTVTFDQAVQLDPAAFALAWEGFSPVHPTGSNPTGGDRTFRLTSDGPSFVDGSMDDGDYTLTIRRSLLRDTYGHALSGDDYSRSSHEFHGDWDADRDVDWTDLTGLLRTYGRRSSASRADAAFDLNRDDGLDLLDLLPMRHRYGKALRW